MRFIFALGTDGYCYHDGKRVLGGEFAVLVNWSTFNAVTHLGCETAADVTRIQGICQLSAERALRWLRNRRYVGFASGRYYPTRKA